MSCVVSPILKIDRPSKFKRNNHADYMLDASQMRD